MYSSGQGLYIRLRGLFNNLDKVHMVYTGVNNITAGKTLRWLKLLILRHNCTSSCVSVVFFKGNYWCDFRFASLLNETEWVWVHCQRK